MTARRRNYIKISLVFFVLAILIAGIARTKDLELLPDNPTRGVAQGSITFWNEGTITRRDLYASHDEIVSLSKANPASFVWQDRFSIGVDGQILPKHAVLFSAVIAPIYGLFGTLGFWLLNQLSLLAIFIGVYGLCERYASERASLLAVVFLGFGSQIVLMSYGFNYDLTAAAAVVWAFRYALKYPCLAAALVVLAFLVRPTNFLFGFFIPFWVLCQNEIRTSKLFCATRFLASFVALASPALLVNFFLWGSPISGAYERLPTYSNGEIIFDTVTHALSFETLATSLFSRAIYGPDSILWWYPSWALVFLGMFRLLKERRGEASLFGLLGIAVVFGCLMMSFPPWEGIGSWRFVLPSVALSWPLVAIALERNSGHAE